VVSEERQVVLIGGAGFIGQHLAARLARHGWHVRVTSRQAPPDRGTSGRVEAVRADLRDEDQVKSAVGSAAAVVNLVGIGRERGQSFEAVHVAGAARVARLAAAAGVGRLVHLSALGIDEEAPAAADRTKARGEVAARAAFPAATLVRPGLVYGPGDHFFGRFAAMARTSPVLPVIGGGRTLFQPIHVEDAVRAIEALLDRAETAGMILALVGTETFTFRELLRRMLGVLGRRRLILPLPFPLAERLAAALERLPDPSLSREDVRLLRTDKIAGDLPTPASLGVATRSLADGLPSSLGASR
jgi:uncharacterized protein YbjT (DUF2867 family)